MKKITFWRSTNKTKIDHSFHGTDEHWHPEFGGYGTGGFEKKEIEISDDAYEIFQSLFRQIDELKKKLANKESQVESCCEHYSRKRRSLW